MRKKVFGKLFTAILATLSLCLLLSVIGYTAQAKQEPNTYYMAFTEVFVIYLIFIAPMFLTVGILFSIIVDSKVKGILKTILSYLIGGGIFGLLYYLIIVGFQANSSILREGILLFVCYGAFSSLFFYGIQLALKPIFHKLNFY